VIARLKESVWMPVAGKAVAILAGMLALAGVGAWSTLQGSGVPLAMASGHSPAMPPGEAQVPLAASTTANPPAPSSGSATPPSSAAPGAASPPEVSGIAPDGRVILNLATADELTRLPRVGAKRAENILALRKKLGRFRQPTDLLRVKGIGRKTLQLMLPKLVLDAPKQDLTLPAPSPPASAPPRSNHRGTD
jgi:competence protein ComEA